MASPPRPSSSSSPSAFGATRLPTRRLRYDSDAGLEDPGDLEGLSAAERNEVAPPAPVYKVGRSVAPRRAGRCLRDGVP